MSTLKQHLPETISHLLFPPSPFLHPFVSFFFLLFFLVSFSIWFTDPSLESHSLTSITLRNHLFSSWLSCSFVFYSPLPFIFFLSSSLLFSSPLLLFFFLSSLSWFNHEISMRFLSFLPFLLSLGRCIIIFSCLFLPSNTFIWIGYLGKLDHQIDGWGKTNITSIIEVVWLNYFYDLNFCHSIGFTSWKEYLHTLTKTSNQKFLVTQQFIFFLISSFFSLFLHPSTFDQELTFDHNFLAKKTRDWIYIEIRNC